MRYRVGSSPSPYSTVAKKQVVCMHHVALRRPCLPAHRQLSKILVRVATLTPARIIREEGTQLFGKSKNRKQCLFSRIKKKSQVSSMRSFLMLAVSERMASDIESFAAAIKNAPQSDANQMLFIHHFLSGLSIN